MKKFKIIAFFVLSSLAFSSVAFADVYVRGHNRGDGTYVDPHYRSDPDGNKDNNWSHRGNRNPYTGSKGHKR